LEKVVEIRCLKEDVEVINKIIPEIEKAFNSLVIQKTKLKLKSSLSVNTKYYLSEKTE